jgi:hypothetical protein
MSEGSLVLEGNVGESFELAAQPASGAGVGIMGVVGSPGKDGGIVGIAHGMRLKWFIGFMTIYWPIGNGGADTGSTGAAFEFLKNMANNVSWGGVFRVTSCVPTAYIYNEL